MTQTTDARGLTLSGATPAEAAAFDAVERAYFEHRLSAYPDLKALCAAAPDFAFAHLFKGFLLLSMGTRDTVPAARACYAHVEARIDELTVRERHHLRALDAWARGDSTAACDCWDDALRAAPLDLLALRLQHFALFWLGDAARMRAAVERVLPAWRDGDAGEGVAADSPAHANLLGMHAFALNETGEFAAAERAGRAAVERDPEDLWAVHAVAHVLEMQGRLDEGGAWLDGAPDKWVDRNPFAAHLWWHAAMFAWEKGDFDRALALYDAAVRPAESTFYLDIQNSASLLARLEFAGIEVGARWEELADAAEARISDHALLFTEPHCAMAFARSGRFDQAARHLESLREFARASASRADARVIESVVAPLCEAIGAFYRGEFADAAARFTELRAHYPAIGGSHAQRDVFDLYRIDAAARSDLSRARDYLAARVVTRANSAVSWRRYADVCAALGDESAAAAGSRQCARITAAGAGELQATAGWLPEAGDAARG